MDRFSRPTRDWFLGAFSAPTPAQNGAWNAISSGAHALVVAPTGSGKTLAAFLWALDRLLVSAPAEPDALPGLDPAAKGGRRKPAQGKAPKRKTRVLYISPLKALGVDVERNLRAPLIGITQTAKRLGLPGPAHYRGRPVRGHDGVGPPLAAQPPARYPHHHPGIALPDADVQGPRNPQRGGHDHCRRGPRRRRHQARGASGGVAGTAGRAAAQARPADRAVGHRGTQGAGGAVPRRLGAGGNCRPSVTEELGPDRLRPGGGHVRSPGRRRRLRLRSGLRAAAPGLHLAACGGKDRGPGAGQPVHHRVCELPPPRRTADRPAQRDLRRAPARGSRRRLDDVAPARRASDAGPRHHRSGFRGGGADPRPAPAQGLPRRLPPK